MSLKNSFREAKPVASARRTQLITTYGIGSLIPAESESFIVLGQDSWPQSALSEENRIEEPRLARILRVDKFFQPPTGKRGRLMLHRFPKMVFCPSCHRLDLFWKLACKDSHGDYTNFCNQCRVKTNLVPSRFITACRAGHLDDFPYMRWVHDGESTGDAEAHKLSFTSNGKDGTLSGLFVVCSCGRRRSMAGALGPGLPAKCFSNTPWLDSVEDDGELPNCDQQLVGLQRGASNVWYANVKSALRLDRDETPAEAFHRNNLLLLPKDLSDDQFVERISAFCASQAMGALADDIIRIHTSYLAEVTDPKLAEIELLAEEYEALKRNHPENDGDELFVCVVHNSADNNFPDFLNCISEVPRLREVTALTSFSRIGGSQDEEFPKASLSVSKMNWLPAIEVFGEGVFLELDENAVDAWERTEFARLRAERLSGRSHEVSGVSDPITPRRLLLHSLSHVLIRELSLQTGYPATALKERIYGEDKQAGILLYTASADSAGSLGGLTAQGKPNAFLRILEGAIAAADWCTADPVCIENSVHGANRLNLAACHYCMLLPEVSCQFSNGYLDRGVLIGTPEAPGNGFFSGF